MLKEPKEQSLKNNLFDLSLWNLRILQQTIVFILSNDVYSLFLLLTEHSVENSLFFYYSYFT